MKLMFSSFFLFIFSCHLHAYEQGETVDDFSLPSLTSPANIKYSDYKGLVVYVDFWASWCSPCAKAFPELNKIYYELQPYGFEIIAISTDENIKDAQKFLSKYPGQFLVAHDQTGVIAKQFNLPGMPAGYLIDTRGKIKKIILGLQKQKDVDALVEEIKKELGV